MGKRKEQKENGTFVSLFCGCGGFDLGFVQGGFRCLGAFDIDPLAVDTYNSNFLLPANVCDLAHEQNSLSDLAQIDVVIAGPPCQGFSTAGKRRLDDPRNSLLLVAGEIALRIRPKVFIAENVRGVVSGDHKEYWDRLHALMASGGYRTHDLLLNAEQYGLAQTRKRMILVAWSSQMDWLPVTPSRQPVTLRDALAININGADNHDVRPLVMNSDLAKIAKRIKPGQKLCNVRGGPLSVHTWDIPEVFGAVLPTERKVLEAIVNLRRRLRRRDWGDADPVSEVDVAEEMGCDCKNALDGLVKKGYVREMVEGFDITHAFNGKFRRLRWDKSSPTVDTRFIDPRYFLHPEEERGFTVREAARIQGFPDWFRFLGKPTEQARCLGNAVPPPLAEWIATSIRPLLAGRSRR